MSYPKIVMLLAVALISGCAKDPSPNAITRRDAERINSEKMKVQAQIENTPPNANTRFAAGQLAESDGDLERAINQYQAALNIEPTHAGALFQLGYIYTGQRKFPQAIEIWNRFVKATNNSAAGYSNLGFCLELSGKFTDAENAYKTGIATDPKNPSCRVNYGLMLARQNRMPEATVQLQTVLTEAEVHYNLASVLESQGKNADAKIEYQKSLQIDPKMYDAKARLAALE